MTKLDGYFRKFTDKLLYLDLKEETNYDLLNQVSLPIYTDDMSKKIISGDMKNKVDLESILQAMIINLAIDKDFRFINDYIIILEKYLDNITGFATRKAIENLGKDDLKALLLTRGAYIINPLDIYNSYNYARLLWPKAYTGDKEYRDEFIKEALAILQNIISQDEDFPLSYYELGNIYRNLGEYIKSRSYYTNALKRTEDEAAKEEIRNKLEEVDDNAEIEEALYYIGKGNNDMAIKILTKLLSKKTRSDAYYYLGVAYQNLALYENSILAFQNSLDKGGEFRQLYNDYAVSLYASGRHLDALEIIEQGLEIFPEDPRLSYNKIQVNISIGNINKAKEDLNNMLTYDDLSDQIFNNLMIIKEQFKI